MTIQENKNFKKSCCVIVGRGGKVAAAMINPDKYSVKQHENEAGEQVEVISYSPDFKTFDYDQKNLSSLNVTYYGIISSVTKMATKNKANFDIYTCGMASRIVKKFFRDKKNDPSIDYKDIVTPNNSAEEADAIVEMLKSLDEAKQEGVIVSVHNYDEILYHHISAPDGVIIPAGTSLEFVNGVAKYNDKEFKALSFTNFNNKNAIVAEPYKMSNYVCNRIKNVDNTQFGQAKRQLANCAWNLCPKNKVNKIVEVNFDEVAVG